MDLPDRLFAGSEHQLNQLRREQEYLNSVIGGWPPKIRDVEHAREIFSRWSGAVDRAETLHQDKPNDLDRMVLYANLLRMGHNINSPGTGETCRAILNDVLKRAPDHFEAHYRLACFYGSIPDSAGLAETHFLAAQGLAGSREIPDVYHGLGLASLHQGKLDDAIRHFDTYLTLAGESPEVQEIFACLRSGTQPRLLSRPRPWSGNDEPVALGLEADGIVRAQSSWLRLQCRGYAYWSLSRIPEVYIMGANVE